jgi:DNA-binding LacI/PurR family transcriptional regulator/ribosomal protein S25
MTLSTFKQSGEGERGLKRHLQISNQILDDVKQGVFQLGDKLPSQSELVDKYKVSVATIRQSLSNLERRGLIRTEKGKGSFISLQANSSQRPRKLSTLGLIFERTGKPDDVAAETQVLLAFSDVCRQKGIRLVSAETDFDAHLGGKKLIETFADTSIDGVCAFLHHSCDAAERISILGKEFRSSVVFFPGSSYSYVMPIDTIDIDTLVGVEQLMDYFLAMGHRRIGYVGTEIDYISDRNSGKTMGRFEIYRDALKKNGLLNPEYVVDYSYGREPSPETMQAVLNLVRRKDPVTAIFACSDWLARHIMYWFWREGIRVPQDVSIAGFDDIVFSKELIPPLTTVSFPFTRAAETAINFMEDRLADPGKNIQKNTISSKLVIRESVNVIR